MTKLDERSKKILWAIIKSYSATNWPVGSRTVTKKYSFGLSSATIRNTMADLEELGYLSQPHTSAGRIPTERGYRLYVDTILKECPISINRMLAQQLSMRLKIIEEDINRLIKEASKTLSLFSCYLGLATPPKAEETTLKRIEFIKRKGNNVIGILISEEGIVKNRFIALEETMTQKQLDKISRYLNNKLTGLTLREIKSEILSQMHEEKTICDKLIADALRLCNYVVTWEDENIFYMGEISGTCNLQNFATMKQIQKLFKAIEEKHFTIKLLDTMSESEGIQVFIGSENFIPEMRGLSMVASTYNDNNRILGTVGIIGPTSMNYEKVISLVDTTARTITQILSER